MAEDFLDNPFIPEAPGFEGFYGDPKRTNIGPRPTSANAVARATFRGDRQQCNAAGGFHANDICYLGQDAVDFINNMSEDSPAYDRGQRWLGDYDQYGWLQDFINIFRPYIEDQDADDIDRINRQEEADAFIDILKGVQNGTVDPDELRNFESDYLSEIPGWNDYYQGVLGSLDSGETQEPTEEGADPFQSLYDKYGKEIVDDAKEKYDEIVKVLGEAAEDPFGAIEKIIGTVSSGTTECKEADLPDWVRNCVTVGVLYGIPGLPLPPIPGVMGTTIGEIEEGFKKIGRNVQDIFDGAETCGEEGDELCTWGEAVGRLGDWVLEKADEVLGDITDPDDIGDWVNGVLGPILGGLIFSEIGDQLEDIFFPVGDVDKDDTTKCTEGTLDPTTGLCICADGSIEAEDGTCAEVEAELSVCKDPNATNYNEEGECQYPDADVEEEDEQLPLTETSTVDDLCSQPRPEQYGFGQISWDKYCGGGSTTTGTDSTDQPRVDCQDNPQATPLECGWVECAGGGFAPTQEECGTDKEIVLGADSSSTDGGAGGGGGGGGAGAFEGTVRGLSYQPQPVPGLLSGAPVDAMGELNQFISRQLQRRSKGMLT